MKLMSQEDIAATAVQRKQGRGNGMNGQQLVPGTDRMGAQARRASSRDARARARVARRAAAVISVLSLVAGCSPPDARPAGESRQHGERPARRRRRRTSSAPSSRSRGRTPGLGQPEKNVIDMEVARINAAGGINGHPLEVVVARRRDRRRTRRSRPRASSSTRRRSSRSSALPAAARRWRMRGEIDKARRAAGLDGGRHGHHEAVRQAGVPDAVEQHARRPVRAEVHAGQGHQEGRPALRLERRSARTASTVAQGEHARSSASRAVAEETFNPGDTDMTAQLTKIKAPIPTRSCS